MALFSGYGYRSALIQFVRHRSQRRSLGKAPGVARSLQQRLDELNYKDPSVYYRVDIGFACQANNRKDQLVHRVAQLKANRQALEHQARNNKLLVPLEEVRDEWDGGKLVMAAADHYEVYTHLFGDAYFKPALPLNITYEGSYTVHCGNLLTPTIAKSKPRVEYESSGDSLWTLALTTPDGHFSSSDREYILWLVGNIKGNNVEGGEEVVPYMQPFPLSGIGQCRYVFVLYKQQSPIDWSSLVKQPNTHWNNVDERDFSTYELYRKIEDNVTPASLGFFQAEWDQSVRTLFQQTLKRAEPICQYDFPAPYHTKQKWFPLKQPFNLYLDRYRDEKQIAKEYLMTRMKDYDVWTGFKPALQFPNAIPFKHRTPSWLKNEMRKRRNNLARFQDY